jgi:hypothetical protein
MPRLRSVTQGCCGPCKGPCFDAVLEGRDVSVKVVWVLDLDRLRCGSVLRQACARVACLLAPVERKCSSCLIANMRSVTAEV